MENPRLSNYLINAFQQVSRLWDLAAILSIWRLKEFTNPLRTIFAKITRFQVNLSDSFGHKCPEEAYVNAHHLSLIFVIWPYSLN